MNPRYKKNKRLFVALGIFINATLSFLRFLAHSTDDAIHSVLEKAAETTSSMLEKLE